MTVTQTAALMMHSAKPTDQHGTGKNTFGWNFLRDTRFKVLQSALKLSAAFVDRQPPFMPFLDFSD